MRQIWRMRHKLVIPAVEGLDSSIARRVIGLQSSAKKVAHAGLEE